MTTMPFPALEMIKKLSEGLKVPMINVEQVVDHQRRNVEVIAANSQVAVESVTALVAKQRDILQSTFTDAQSVAKKISFPTHPQAVVKAQSEFTQRTLDTLIASSCEMVAIIHASQLQMFGLLQQRMTQGAEDLRANLSKSLDT